MLFMMLFMVLHLVPLALALSLPKTYHDIHFNTWFNQLNTTYHAHPPPAPGTYSPETDDPTLVVFRGKPHRAVTNLFQAASVAPLTSTEYHVISGRFSKETLEVLEQGNQVAFVEPDRWVYAADMGSSAEEVEPGVKAVSVDGSPVAVATQKNPASWGLNRIDKRKRTESPNQFQYPASAGADVTIYVLDTGIDVDHPMFEGRVQLGPNFSSFRQDANNTIQTSSTPSRDDNGHGTFVAGILTSSAYGVARNASVVSIKLLDSQKRARVSNVIAAMQYIYDQHMHSPSKKTVVNMSVDAEKSEAMNKAIMSCADAGVLIVVAAGNGDGSKNPYDACTRSPASIRHPNVLTVGATDMTDTVAEFSNRGTCVDLHAPGVDVVSIQPESTAPKTDRGTSFAAPYVTGVCALIWGDVGGVWADGSNPGWDAKRVRDFVVKEATRGAIRGLDKHTANRIVYSGVAIGKGFGREDASTGTKVRIRKTWWGWGIVVASVMAMLGVEWFLGVS